MKTAELETVPGAKSVRRRLFSKDRRSSKFFDELTVQMREVLKEAGAKVVR